MLSPSELAQAQLDAYHARDIDAFCAVYADDVVFYDLVSGAETCSGIDAVRVKYGAMFERSPLLHCSLVHRMVCGAIVIDEEHVAGLREDGLVHAIATYETSNGRIARAWFIRE